MGKEIRSFRDENILEKKEPVSKMVKPITHSL